MSNMSYCRFQNTIGDMQDCIDNLDEHIREDDRREYRARIKFIEMCKQVAEDYEDVEDIEKELKDNQVAEFEDEDDEE